MGTKFQLLEELTKRTLENEIEENSCFTSNDLSDFMQMSRNTVSQYLNEFVKEKKCIKVNSRPVYFFSKEALENKWKITLDKTIYTSVSELCANKENDFEKIIKWENDYLKDMKNKLRQEHRFVDDCYSLDIYEDLKKLLGYKKYLDGYKEIETEDEMKYALLFGLKECPYPMYSCFVMQNIEADYGVSRGSGLY